MLEENSTVMTRFKHIYNQNQPREKTNEDQLFVIDQYEMDALINQSPIIEYAIAIEDLALIDSDEPALKKIICKQATHYTSHSILAVSYGAQITYHDLYQMAQNTHADRDEILKLECPHFKHYKDEIQTIYEDNTKRPLKLVAPYTCIMHNITSMVQNSSDLLNINTNISNNDIHILTVRTTEYLDVLIQTHKLQNLKVLKVTCLDVIV